MVTSCHHVGCLVNSIETAINDFRIIYPDAAISEVFDIEEQKVKVCFFTMPGINIEFVAPQNEESSLFRLLQKNPGFYHIGLYVKDMNSEIKRLEDNGYHKISQFRSKAFNDRYCAFLYNNEMHLIELIEENAD